MIRLMNSKHNIFFFESHALMIASPLAYDVEVRPGDVFFAEGTFFDVLNSSATGDYENAGGIQLAPISDAAARVQELTASGAVTAGVQSVELNHATVVVAATIADAANHPGLFIVKDTSASGTAAHTLTLTAGTFDGTNNVATLNAPNEALVVYFDSAGNGTILVNVGAVALS